MAEDVYPATYDMYSKGFSGGGHLMKETYPQDQISIQRHGDASRADNDTTIYETYDGISRRMLSTFAEHQARSLPTTFSTGRLGDKSTQTKSVQLGMNSIFESSEACEFGVHAHES
eukprot:4803729-Amphidinium_carterae.1